MQKDTLNEFLTNNSTVICSYINTEILEDIGRINPDYFKKIITNLNSQEIEMIDKNILPYFLLSQIGKIDYTSLRVENINLNLLDKEASVYYNYAKFSLTDTLFCIDLMQTKIGGMPIDNDIIKFSKKIPIKNRGLAEYLSKNSLPHH